MEILEVFADIAEMRKLHELRRCLLQRLVELSSPAHHKLHEYTTQLNILNMFLEGTNKHSEYLDNYFSFANQKDPKEWSTNDFHSLLLVVAEGSLMRAQNLIEKLLPNVSRNQHPMLLYNLGKCYLTSSRYE